MLGPTGPNADRRGVAQSGSAPVLGTGCRRFKSYRPDHFSQTPSVLIIKKILLIEFDKKWYLPGNAPSGLSGFEIGRAHV